MKDNTQSTTVELTEKVLKKKKLKFLILVSIILVIVALSYFLFHNFSNLKNYNYTNSFGDTYQIKFFKNANVVNVGSFNSLLNYKDLVGYATKKSKYRVALSIIGFPGNNNNKSIKMGKNGCSLSRAQVSFSVYVDSVRSNAVFCTLAGAEYFSYFGSGNTAYYLQLFPQDTSFNPYLGQATTSDTSSMPSINIMKSIVSSFRFISKQ